MRRVVLGVVAAALAIMPTAPAGAHWWTTKMWNQTDRLYCQRLPSRNIWYVYWGC